MSRRFFSGSTLDQAVMMAARHYGIDPQELAYRQIEKKHGFLRTRKAVMISVDPNEPRREPPAGAAASAPPPVEVKAPLVAEPAAPPAPVGPPAEPMATVVIPAAAEGAAEPPEAAPEGASSEEASSEASPEEASPEDAAPEDVAEDAVASWYRGPAEGRPALRNGRLAAARGADEGAKPVEDAAAEALAEPDEAGSEAFAEPDEAGSEAFAEPDEAGSEAFAEPDEPGATAFSEPEEPGAAAFSEPDEMGAEAAIDDELLRAAERASQTLLRFAGIDAEASARRGRERIEVDIEGPDDSVLVVEGGKGLLAIQHMLPRMLRGLTGRSSFVRVDSQDFHRKRKERLQALALKEAEATGRDGRPRTLPPMTPDERRLVHLALKDSPAVVTESRGSGLHKRVVISPAPGFDGPDDIEARHGI